MTRVPPAVRAALVLAVATLGGGVAAPAALAAGRPVQLLATDGRVVAGQVYEADPRPAPAVVLVHMLGRSQADWEALALALQGTGITALAIDLRGHGASGGTVGALPDMVHDVRGAFQWLAARPGVRPHCAGAPAPRSAPTSRSGGADDRWPAPSLPSHRASTTGASGSAGRGPPPLRARPLDGRQHRGCWRCGR